MDHSFTPLANLTDDCYRWKVCVRLEKKFSITNFTTKKSGREGKFCTFEFVDTAGTHMNAQAYDDICEKLHNELDIGKVYCISGCRIQKTQSPRSTGKYQFVFGPRTRIEEKRENVEFPAYSPPSLLSVNTVLDLKPGVFVDIIASVKSATNLVDQKTRSGNEIPMRELELCDGSTEETITLTLWDSFAQNFDPKKHKVVLVHGGKLSVFEGSLGIQCTKTTVVEFNPPENREEISEFMEWYKTSNKKQESFGKQRSSSSGSSSKSKDYSDDENPSETPAKKRIHPSSIQKDSPEDESLRISDGTRSSTAARNASSKKSKAA